VIPFAVNRASAQWRDRTVTAGVIIDRLRMLELLNELDDEELRGMVDTATQNWTDAQASSLLVPEESESAEQAPKAGLTPHTARDDGREP
jgi:hypothetical protein